MRRGIVFMLYFTIFPRQQHEQEMTRVFVHTLQSEIASFRFTTHIHLAFAALQLQMQLKKQQHMRCSFAALQLQMQLNLEE
jgi:hypothetical protein